MEAIYGEPSRAEDLRAFERQYFNEINQSAPTNQTKFNYAWCLIKSASKHDNAKGIRLLEELSESGDPDAARDYLFYLAIGCTKIEDYDRALECVKIFLRAEPQNRQALQLKEVIEKRLKEKAIKGAAITGGAVAIGAGLIGLAVALLRK